MICFGVVGVSRCDESFAVFLAVKCRRASMDPVSIPGLGIPHVCMLGPIRYGRPQASTIDWAPSAGGNSGHDGSPPGGQSHPNIQGVNAAGMQLEHEEAEVTGCSEIWRDLFSVGRASDMSRTSPVGAAL